MFPDTSDSTRLLFQALAGLVLIAGATADLYLGLLFQTRRIALPFSELAAVARRPFTVLHAKLVLVCTLFFAVATLLQPEQASAAPQDKALIIGPLFYAVTGLSVVAVCLAFPRLSFRQAFLSPSCPAPQALRKGLLYGLAAVPPIVLLSQLVTDATRALGYDLHRQEVFDWLSDGSLALGTRLFMLAAATFLAPVVEELLFRGILFPSVLKQRSFLFAALLSGSYFALIHFHAPSFLPLLALSLALSAGYAATGSILTPVAMHAVFNVSAVFFYLADGT